jgi:type I restriction enzyme S subunit
MIRLRFAPLSPLPQFSRVVWMSRLVRQQIEKKARTTAGIFKISQRDIEGFRLPLPPLAEQGSIVGEVERRLSIVEEVETAIEADLKRAARLRQSVLKRAFEGRLVPQDSLDEPAEQLLDRIRQEQATAGNGEPAGRRRSPSSRRRR